jgi:hypothetical protein
VGKSIHYLGRRVKEGLLGFDSVETEWVGDRDGLMSRRTLSTLPVSRGAREDGDD